MKTKSDNLKLWTIEEQTFSVDKNTATEGLFTLGSGYLHVRGSLEEHLFEAPQNETYLRTPANVTAETFHPRKAKWGCYVPGMYGKHPLLNNEIINLPSFLELTPYVAGEKLDMERSDIEEFSRKLHLDTAMVERVVQWRTKFGAIIDTRFERFVSAAEPSLCCQRLTLKCDRDIDVEVVASIDADVRTNGYDHFQKVALDSKDDGTITCTVTTDAGDRVEIRSLVAGALGKRKTVNERKIVTTCTLHLNKGEPVSIAKYTAVSTSRDLIYSNPLDLLKQAIGMEYDRLFEQHTEEWSRRWNASDVVLEGDEKSQLAMRASIFHLLRAHVPNDTRVAIDAKGYAGEAYWGRFFWDTEMYLLPFFALTQPSWSKTLVDFRVQSLEGAKQNARRYGYSGARYAWESDPAGLECCPNWQYADHEVHVTADVVYGLMFYASAVADASYFDGPAGDVVLETARYWSERIDVRNNGTEVGLLGVMGPDEYKPIIHNNFYTNLLVSYALNAASQIGKRRGLSDEQSKRYGYFADNLPLLRNEKGLYWQCEGFDTFAEPDFEHLWKDRSAPFATQVSQERIYRTKCLKQADVLMGMYLFPSKFTESEVRAAYEYYVPYTTHDSSLSAGTHAIVASRLGKLEEAWSFWQKSCGIDIDGGASEGIHIAGAGANWLIIVFGFAGLGSPVDTELLTLRPHLPKQLSKISFPIVWKGNPIEVEITHEQVHVTNKGVKDLAALLCGTNVVVKAGGSIQAENSQG
jgi:kojibiose phosphorylase